MVLPRTLPVHPAEEVIASRRAQPTSASIRKHGSANAPVLTQATTTFLQHILDELLGEPVVPDLQPNWPHRVRLHVIKRLEQCLQARVRNTHLRHVKFPDMQASLPDELREHRHGFVARAAATAVDFDPLNLCDPQPAFVAENVQQRLDSCRTEIGILERIKRVQDRFAKFVQPLP